MNMGEVLLTEKSTHFMNVWCRYFQRFCTILHLREESYEQFLHYVAAVTFFCMSAKHKVSSQSTFYIALKHLKKSTHFMLTM